MLCNESLCVSVGHLCRRQKTNKTNPPPLADADFCQGAANKIIRYTSESATRGHADTVYIQDNPGQKVQIQTVTKKITV